MIYWRPLHVRRCEKVLQFATYRTGHLKWVMNWGFTSSSIRIFLNPQQRLSGIKIPLSTRNLLKSKFVTPPYWFILRYETGYDFSASSVSKISGFAAEFAGCVWTETVSGKKKIRIQTYPDTSGRGLRQKRHHGRRNISFRNSAFNN